MSVTGGGGAGTDIESKSSESHGRSNYQWTEGGSSDRGSPKSTLLKILLRIIIPILIVILVALPLLIG